MSEKNIKVIIFDLFGTILKFDNRQFIRALKDNFDLNQRNVLDFLKQDLVTDYENISVAIQQFGKNLGIDIENPEQYQKLYDLIESHTASIEMVKGAKSLIKFYKRKGYQLAVISNISKIFYQGVVNTGILEDFDEVLLSFEVGLKKPDKNIFQLAMERFQVQAENCLLIGDSLVSDFYPSTEIGMQSICLRKTTFSSSDRVIDFNHLAFLNLENKKQYWESALNDLFHLPDFKLEILEDKQQGKYNIIASLCFLNEKQESTRLYCKRYLNTEAAYVEELAYEVMDMMDCSYGKVDLIETFEPVLVCEEAKGSNWRQDDLNEESSYLLGEQFALTYLIGNADFRPRNTFINRQDNEIELSVFDLEHCFFNRALKLPKDFNARCPHALDQLNGELEGFTKTMILSRNLTTRARKQFIEVEDYEDSLVKAFFSGWYKLIENAQRKKDEIINLLSTRIYQEPYIIIGTNAYRRAMARIDIEDMITRINSDHKVEYYYKNK